MIFCKILSLKWNDALEICDGGCKKSLVNFCLIEVRAMMVAAVQQPSAECTAIFTVCIV